MKDHGFRRGDFVHTVAGNVQDVFPAMGGVWLLGGKVSGGDIALDSKAIAGQVGKKSWSIKKQTTPPLISCHI